MSEEIKATINRLKAIEHNDLYNIAYAFDTSDERGRINVDDFRTKLIVLLEQANPDTHMKLPVDADGVPIHVGDVMVYADGDTCPKSAIALVSQSVFLTDDGPRYADMCRHHKPTVEEVLRMFLAESEDAMRKGYDEVPDEVYAEYAKLLCLKEADE